MHTVYFSLGANLGDREAAIRRAVDLLGERVGEVARLSSMHVTEPWGFASANAFVNACCCCLTRLTPLEVLAATQQIERELGRTQKSEGGQYHDRPIDIDILLYDNLTIDTPELRVPHPLMRQRDFVMVPLREIHGGI